MSIRESVTFIFLFSILNKEEREFVRCWIISFGEAKRKAQEKPWNWLVLKLASAYAEAVVCGEHQTLRTFQILI